MEGSDELPPLQYPSGVKEPIKGRKMIPWNRELQEQLTLRLIRGRIMEGKASRDSGKGKEIVEDRALETTTLSGTAWLRRP